jgi:predicted DNA-binding antitoxin AbrB/MazE fold protein
MLVKTRTKAVYREGVLRPLKRLDLKEGEEVDIEIKSAVRRTQGIIKIDPEAAREIAESDDYSPLAK